MRSWLSFGVLALTCALFAATSVGAGAAARSTARSEAHSHANATVTSDISYYKNKTISFYQLGAVGSLSYVYAAQFCQYMVAYLHASCSVMTEPSVITAQGIAMSQPPNGLTIGTVSPSSVLGDFITNTPGISFNLRTLQIIGGLPITPYVIVAAAGSGVMSFKQMAASTMPISMLAQIGSGGTLGSELLFGGFGVHPKWVSGYGNSAGELTGFLRGDGQTMFSVWATLGSPILGAKAVPILMTAPPVKGQIGYSILPHVPTIAQYAVAHPPKSKDERTRHEE